jgi:hypothetical protein
MTTPAHWLLVENPCGADGGLALIVVVVVGGSVVDVDVEEDEVEDVEEEVGDVLVVVLGSTADVGALVWFTPSLAVTL